MRKTIAGVIAGFALAGWWRGPRAALGFLLLAVLPLADEIRQFAAV